MSSARRRRWMVAGVALLAVASIAAALIVVRSRPMVDDDELDEVRAYLARERTALEHLRCERSPLVAGAGERVRSSTALVDDLFDPHGPFAPCITTAQRASVVDALQGRPAERTDGAAWRFQVEGTDAPMSGMAPGWGALAVQAPLYASDDEPPALRAVRAACASLPAHLEAIARAPGGCASLRSVPAQGAPEIVAFTAVARAIAVVARGLAADADVHGALSLLLRGVAATHDARRGATCLLVAMVALAAEGILWSTFQTLLVADLGLGVDARADVDRTLETLAVDVPHPGLAFRADWMALEEASFVERPWSALDDGARLRFYLLPLVSADAKRSCPIDQTWSACLANYSRIPPSDDDLYLGIVFGERAIRSSTTRGMVAASRPQFASYVRRLMQSPAWITGARILLVLDRFRREGVCPDRAPIDPALLTIPLLDEPLTIHRLRVEEYEIHAPASLHDAAGPLPLMLTTCPAAGGEWRVD